MGCEGCTQNASDRFISDVTTEEENVRRGNRGRVDSSLPKLSRFGGGTGEKKNSRRFACAFPNFPAKTPRVRRCVRVARANLRSLFAVLSRRRNAPRGNEGHSRNSKNFRQTRTVKRRLIFVSTRNYVIESELHSLPLSLWDL